MSGVDRRRIKAVAAGLFLLLLGGAVLVVGIGDLMALMRGFGEHRAVVVAEPYAASAILLGIFGLSVAAVFLLSKPMQPQPRNRRAPTRAERWSGPYLLFLFACLLAALFAPAAQSLVVGSIAAARGYERCPAVTWPRHQPDRWALNGSAGHCPHEGAPANA